MSANSHKRTFYYRSLFCGPPPAQSWSPHSRPSPIMIPSGTVPRSADFCRWLLLSRSALSGLRFGTGRGERPCPSASTSDDDCQPGHARPLRCAPAALARRRSRLRPCVPRGARPNGRRSRPPLGVVGVLRRIYNLAMGCLRRLGRSRRFNDRMRSRPARRPATRTQLGALGHYRWTGVGGHSLVPTAHGASSSSPRTAQRLRSMNATSIISSP